MSATLTGQTIKGYVFREPLGRGGSGLVYRAAQTDMARDVAIKLILPEWSASPDFIRRFSLEAQTVARLEHPHIVPLYDYWRDPSGAYLVMRLMGGGSLRQALRHDGAWSLGAVARLMDQIGGALDFAHRQDVVHSDLKPDNILLDRDKNAYLADFGIAQRGDRAAAVLFPPDAPRTVSGSLAYITPEQIRNEPVTPQSDLYSLGMLLFELLSGVTAFADDGNVSHLVHAHLEVSVPSLRGFRPDLPASVDEFIQRATAKNPEQRFPDAISMAAEFRRLTAVQGVSVDFPKVAEWPGAFGMRSDTSTALTNPFKGLRAFEETDAMDFFGREALTERLLERMDQPEEDARFLMLIGPSGSGKSSVVKAGLVPAIRHGALPGSQHWFIAEMVPDIDPVRELSAALERVMGKGDPGLAARLRQDATGLSQAAFDILFAGEDDSELLLVIDQFEELFTLLNSEAERVHFLDMLLQAVRAPQSRVRVIVTMRADFYSRPLQYVAFGDLVRQRTEVVLPLSQRELERAIVGPAERVGLQLDLGLADAILADLGQQPGMLPLLQYALTELYERREGSTLTLDAYEASGGVAGALARRADGLFVQLPVSDQNACRQIFLRLVTLGEGTQDTRRRILRSEISVDGFSQSEQPDVILEVIEMYAAYRLLTLDRDPSTRSPTVEVAHEALIRTWTRLRDWLDEDRTSIRLHRQLGGAAAEWVAAGRDPSFLAVGGRLSEFEALAKGGALALNQQETAYLDAGVAQRESVRQHEEARKNVELGLQRRAANRLRYLVVVLLVFLLVAVLLSGFALNSRSDALDSATRSEGLRLAAEANVLLQSNGNADVIALLGVRSLRNVYSPQSDGALLAATTLNYPTRVLSGHTNTVDGVAFSHDGRYLATSGKDMTIRLWDMRSGALIRQFVGHTDSVWSVAFSPDDQTLASASQDQTARLWNVADGKEIRQFVGHTDAVEGVAFSPDGRLLATSSYDKTARLWNVADGKEIRQFVGHTDSLESLAFSPDGRYLLTASHDQTARLWDVATGNTLQIFKGHTNWLYWVAFSPDGQRVVTSSYDKTARVWDVATGNTLQVLKGHNGPVYCVAFSPDGATVLTGGFDRTAILWDAATGGVLQRFASHTGAVWGVAFSPDGRLIATAGEDKTIRLWDLQSHFSPQRVFQHPDSVYGVTFSRDGKTFLSADIDHAVRLWDVESGALLHTYSGHTDAVWLAIFSPDGKHILAGSDDLTAILWDAQTEAVVQTFKGHTSSVYGLAFTPDGKSVVTASDDKTVRLWDVATGKEVRQFVGHTKTVENVSISSDGKTILTASDDQTARLWDVATGKEIRRFVGHTDIVQNAVFSPDGKTILTASNDQTARLWDLVTGKEIRQFVGHTDKVISAVFSGDGRFVATSSADQTARLWDVTTGIELRRFIGHTNVVNGVAFAPDGKYVLTGSVDGTARLWETDYHDAIKAVCARLLRDFTPNERVQYGIADNDPTCVAPGVSAVSDPEQASWTPPPPGTVPVWTPLPLTPLDTDTPLATDAATPPA